MLHNVFIYLSVPICNCRQYTQDYKLRTYLKIARLYLEDEDPVQAEAYINRASMLQADSGDEQLQIHYKVCNHLAKSMFLFLLSPDISICFHK